MSVCTDSDTLHASYGVVDGTYPRRVPMKHWRPVLFTNEPRFTFFTQIFDIVFTDVVGNASPTLASSGGIDLGMFLFRMAFTLL